MKLFVSKTVGCALLVAGTQIGAGMLALPIATGIGGFWPSALLFLIAFAYMLASLFLLVEVNFWSHKVTANIITLAKEHLGIVGQGIAWVSFLFLLYAVAAAYLSGGGALLATALDSGLNVGITPSFGTWIFLLFFGGIVFFGTHIVDSFNRVLISGLVASFLFLVLFTVPNVDPSNLGAGKPLYLLAAVPVVILSFTSHIIVPSLRTYLAGDHKDLIKALFWGSIIPLICYLIWEFLIVGSLPQSGPLSLEAIALHENPVSGLTKALNAKLHVPAVAIVVGFFSFFALVTSFFGVSLGLFDFLADGLRVKKTPFGKCVLLTLAYTPPMVFALLYPEGFVFAVGYAGVFVAVLYGILPPLMIWRGRYIEKRKSDFVTPGGKAVPLLVFLGAFVIIFFQVAATWGLFPSIG